MNSPFTLKALNDLFQQKGKYFVYYINDQPVSREEAKDHLDLHRTKLADLL